MVIERKKYHGELRDGKRLLLKYTIELPTVSGGEADDIINQVIENVRNRITAWVGNKLKSRAEIQDGGGRKNRLYRETPQYRLLCETYVTDEKYIQLHFLSYFGQKKGEYRILLSLESGEALGAGEFCSAEEGARLGNCQFRLGKNDVTVIKKGKLHKIKRI